MDEEEEAGKGTDDSLIARKDYRNITHFYVA